jgi:hypothetical protein
LFLLSFLLAKPHQHQIDINKMLEVNVIAALSVVFYGSLSFVSAFYFRKFRRIQLESPSKDTYYHSKFGRYDSPKVYFFLVLAISALLDVPLYIGCLTQGGPEDCEWHNLAYAIGWFLHLFAVCGYAYTIMIPCILWNDIIQNRDGKLFRSQFQVDSTKRFFQVSLILYILNTTIDTLYGMSIYRIHDPEHFTTSKLDSVLTFTEPMIIFGITVGCFWCGLRLQAYVMKAKLGFRTELRFLLHLNVPMLVIMCTYLARALYVLRFVHFVPVQYGKAMSASYLGWMAVTRWLPYIFCSFVLVLMMRFSGEEIAARHTKNNSQIAGINSPPDRRHAKSIKDALLKNEHVKHDILGAARGSDDLHPLGEGRDITTHKQVRNVGAFATSNPMETSINGSGTSIVRTVSSMDRLGLPFSRQYIDGSLHDGDTSSRTGSSTTLTSFSYLNFPQLNIPHLNQQDKSHDYIDAKQYDPEDDDYYRTSLLEPDPPLEENPSSLESLATRDFSVDYFLHQTMFLNLARSAGSIASISPSKSDDIHQPFV